MRGVAPDIIGKRTMSKNESFILYNPRENLNFKEILIPYFYYFTGSKLRLVLCLA